MGRKRTPGLFLRGEVWHIDKRTKYAPEGRLRESTGETELEEAEAYLARHLAELKDAAVHGKRISHSFEEAAVRFITEYSHLASIRDLGKHLEHTMPFIGHLTVDQVDDEALQPFILHEQKRGLRPKSINNAVGVIHRVLVLCSRKWRDRVGDRKIAWMGEVPLLERLPITSGSSAQPYPLDWLEQDRLLKNLPIHLQHMALYKVNVGCREQEVCQLRWKWEVDVPELGVSIFLVPGWIVEDGKAEGLVKNREDRLHVLNRIARSVIEELRLLRPQHHLDKCISHTEEGKCNCAYTYVFTYKGYKVGKMHNTAWKNAWKTAGLPTGKDTLKGVHNLKHTCGRRLRAAGVGEKTRKVILGHRDGDITSHYSAAEIDELLNAVERITDRGTAQTPSLTVLKVRQSPQNAHKDLEQKKTG
jgi:integrase